MAATETPLQTAREIVCDYMHYSGKCREILTDEEWARVFCLGDGFGPVGAAALDINSGADWSHVRDSSPDAWLAMAAEIGRILKARRQGPKQPKTSSVERMAGKRADFFVTYRRGGKQYFDVMWAPTPERCEADFAAAAAELGWKVEGVRVYPRDAAA